MTAPFEELGTSGHVDVQALRHKRGERGRFAPGVPGPALKTGMRSRLLVDQPEMAAAHREKSEAIAADLGDDIATLKADAVREAARLSLIVESLGDDILRRGALTVKGRKRAALTCYREVLADYVRLMRTLGLERRQRRVTDLAAAFQETQP